MKTEEQACYHNDMTKKFEICDKEVESITFMLKALADSSRLQLLLLLQQLGEVCVSEIVSATQEKMTTISNRLKQLHDAGLISKRRDGQHILYALEDEHVEALLSNLIAHAKHTH